MAGKQAKKSRSRIAYDYSQGSGHKKTSRNIWLLVTAFLLVAATVLLSMNENKTGEPQPKAIAPKEYKYVTDFYSLTDFNVTGCAEASEGLVVRNVPENASVSAKSEIFVFTEKGLVAERSVRYEEISCMKCSGRSLWFSAQSSVPGGDCRLEYRIEFTE